MDNVPIEEVLTMWGNRVIFRPLQPWREVLRLMYAVCDQVDLVRDSVREPLLKDT